MATKDSNGFTETEQAFIREVARQIVVEVLPSAFELHVAACPVQKKISKGLVAIMCVCIAANVVTVGSAPQLIAALKSLIGP